LKLLPVGCRNPKQTNLFFVKGFRQSMYAIRVYPCSKEERRPHCAGDN
jgi:hypothetical protein